MPSKFNFNTCLCRCPKDWVFSTNIGCFHFGENVMTYEDALQYCKDLTTDGGLAEIINEDTQYFLTGVLVTKQLYLHDHWWIGANDRNKEGKWIWEHSGKEVAYNNWRVGEPNDFGGQDFGMMKFAPL